MRNSPAPDTMASENCRRSSGATERSASRIVQRGTGKGDAVRLGFEHAVWTNWVVARPIPRPAADLPHVTVVCPCRNEEGNIREVVRRLPALGSHTELIFVEGHSMDGTLGECRRLAAVHSELEPPEHGQVREKAVGEAAEGAEPDGEEDVAACAYRLEAGESKQILDVAAGGPVQEGQRILEAERLEQMQHGLPHPAVPVDDDPRSRMRDGAQTLEGRPDV